MVSIRFRLGSVVIFIQYTLYTMYMINNIYRIIEKKIEDQVTEPNTSIDPLQISNDSNRR